MRKLPILLSCFLIVFSFLPSKTWANHGAGGEIIYEWISGSTYRVFLKFYRDCTGPPAPDSMPLCFKNSCNTNINQVWMQLYPGVIPPNDTNGSSVALGCSPTTYPTKCTNPTSNIPGYQEWWYYYDLTLPFQCNNWTFYTYLFARNFSANLVNPLSTYFYTETTFNNTGTFEGNSSPYFSNKPIPYVCVNIPYQFNNGAVDPNGDSLSTDVQQPLNFGATCNSIVAPIPFNTNTAPYPAYNLSTNPIQTGNTFTLNASTGQITFTAPQIGAYTLSVRTREFRGGVLIGSILRDVQVQVIGNCAATAPQVVIKPPTGVPFVNGQIWGCAGQLLTFDYDLTSSDPNAVLLGADNHIASIPAATTSYVGQKTDSVRGTFSWTPGINQSGLFTLTVSVRDSTCAPPGILYTYINTIPIFIWPPVKASNDTSVCPGQPVQLNASGGGNYLWSTIAGPANTLSCTNCQAPLATTYGTASYRVFSQQTAFCDKNADTVVVTMLPSPTFTPLTDILTCPGIPSTFDLQLQPITGVTYN
ncbi:MAG: hypothetical protein K0R82_2721, partial [Flavipsychrobacter sp.]|nr:hypothetical protein [Flavipsychrobacter sp.]